jgi:hypothetical protein
MPGVLLITVCVHCFRERSHDSLQKPGRIGVHACTRPVRRFIRRLVYSRNRVDGSRMFMLAAASAASEQAGTPIRPARHPPPTPFHHSNIPLKLQTTQDCVPSRKMLQGSCALNPKGKNRYTLAHDDLCAIRVADAMRIR